MPGTIYVIKNKVNDKVYVGQTIQDFNKRFSDHLYNAYNTDKNSSLYNAIRKHGASKFYIEIVESNIPKEILTDKEEYYIRKYDSVNHGYNMKYRVEDPRFSTIYEIDDETFIELYNRNTNTDLSKQFNVSRTVIINRARKLKLTQKPIGLNKPHLINNNIFTKEILYDLYIIQKLTINTIAGMYKVNPGVIKTRLAKYNIKKFKGLHKETYVENDMNLDTGCDE